MAVARRDRVKSAGLECPDSRQLGLRASHLISGDFAVRCDFQCVAKQCRIVEFCHERHGKLCERITQNEDLCLPAEFIEEFLRARKRIDRRDCSLDFLQSESMLLQDGKSVLHELVIIRFVAGRAAQLRDTGSLRKCDPDFRYKYAFHIQANNIHPHI